jgi:hypothetical protein
VIDPLVIVSGSVMFNSMPSKWNPFRHSDRLPDSGAPHRYAFRIESDRVILAVATVTEGQSRIEILVDYVPLNNVDGSDDIETGEAELAPALETTRSKQDWLLGAGWKRLRDAIDTLATRHRIGHQAVAVSLSGDFCVTRISTGTVDDVDHELGALASRIPRYLQLGPGGKLTGQIRETLSPGIDHALTAVGNFTRLKSLYEAFVSCHVNVAWIEPSLVSIARLAGVCELDQEKPILIADSFGQSWEVGITHQGRLLLDYRPAAAYDAETFATAIDQHLARLQRFCQRHRGMAQSSLSELYVGGPAEKVNVVLNRFSDQHSLHGATFRLPTERWTVEVPAEIESDSVAAIAAVLPLIQPELHQNPPDLLQTIRRERDQSRFIRAAITFSPLAVAALLLMVTTLWVGGLRRQSEQKQQQRDFVQTQMQATQARMATLQSDRRWVRHLGTIKQKSVSPPLVDLVNQITRCLPPAATLASIRVDPDHSIMLVGKTADEAEIYEIVGYLRRLPDIQQAALLATASGGQLNGESESQFEVRLSWQAPVAGTTPLDSEQELQDE